MAGNYLYEKEPANRDEIPEWESSLGGETCKSG